jgi:hypothetical protein
MRRASFAVVLAALVMSLGACVISEGGTTDPSIAPPASPTPADPVYTLEQVKAALVAPGELPAVWHNRPGVTPRGVPETCDKPGWAQAPAVAQVARVDLLDQRNDEKHGIAFGNTISQIGLVFTDRATASAYLESIRTAGSACPAKVSVPRRVRNGSTESAYTVTMGLQPMTIAAWQGFVLTEAKVYATRGFSDGRVVVLGRGNAVVVLSLGLLTSGRNATKPNWDTPLHGYFDRIFHRIDSPTDTTSSANPTPQPSRS